jgi:uncharacterized surface protein with fasciclin (FAS1) repeats
MVRSLRLAVVALVVLGLGSVLTSAGDKNIVETAIGAKKFETLVTAVKAAGLVETLSGPGPFTVFAPTDEAFAKLGQETIDSVLKNKEQLTAILKLHVVSGKVMANKVVTLKEAETLGGKLPIRVEGNTVMVGKAKVIKTDIECSNGVIHVIDTVLLPDTK